MSLNGSEIQDPHHLRTKLQQDPIGKYFSGTINFIEPERNKNNCCILLSEVYEWTGMDVRGRMCMWGGVGDLWIRLKSNVHKSSVQVIQDSLPKIKFFC